MNEVVVETVKGWCPAEMGVKQKEGGFGKLTPSSAYTHHSGLPLTPNTALIKGPRDLHPVRSRGQISALISHHFQ